MDVKLDIRKSVEENASAYFEKAKKARKKLAGAKNAIEKTRIKLGKLLEMKDVEEKEMQSRKKPEKLWYEKFRWFTSSEGFLCIGGRDATSNEIVVKKHAEKGDLVFHTEMAGSPFFVVKSGGKKIGEQTIQETAVATASFSRAWKLGLSHAEVFYVNPDQLSRTPKAGEYLEKGSFIVNGKAEKIMTELKLSVGVNSDGKVMCAPVESVKKNCLVSIPIAQGDGKSTEVAKQLLKKLNLSREFIDSVVSALPSGGCRIMQQ